MAYEDLLKDTSVAVENGDYFLLTITDLDPGQTYPLQLRWNYADKTQSLWSAVKSITTPIEGIPTEPDLADSDVVGGAGFITVTWNGLAGGITPENLDRADVYISGTGFGSGSIAGSFKTAGTQTFAAAAGIYIVQLKIITARGTTSLFSDAKTITVITSVPTPAASVTPSTPTVSQVLGAIQLAWDGKTSTGSSQPTGFNAARVYVGTTSGFTILDSNQVDVLNFSNGQNTLNIGVGTLVNGVALDYGIDYYVKIATTNGSDLSAPVLATGSPVRIGQVKSGDIVEILADKISSGTIKAGSTIKVGSDSGKQVVLSGTGDPLTIYGTGHTPVLSYGSNGLTIIGDGTFSGNLSAAGGSFTGTLSGASGSFSGTIVASAGSIGGITIATDALQNSSNTFKIDNTGKARFGGLGSGVKSITLDPSGSLYHGINGIADGTFTLNSGGTSTIAGWNISSEQIYSGDTHLYNNGVSGDTGLRIQAGTTTPFKVYNDGSMYTSKGKIGSDVSNYWTIDSTGIVSNGAARIKVGNYEIKSSGTDFTIYDTGSSSTIIKTESVSGATDSPLRIFLGDSSRQVELAKSAQISGTGTTSFDGVNQTAINAYRSGGLRNMYTVASTQFSLSLYPSAFTGDVLLVYNPA